MAKKKAQTSTGIVAGCTVKMAGTYYRPGDEIPAEALEQAEDDVLEGMLERGELIEEANIDEHLEHLKVEELEARLKDANVDLKSIKGTGANGAVVQRDLVAALRAL